MASFDTRHNARRTFDHKSIVGLDKHLANHVVDQLDDFMLVGATMKTMSSRKQIVQIWHFFVPSAELQLT